MTLASDLDAAELPVSFFERRVSLKSRLLIGLVVLVAIGLVSASVIIYNSTRSSLLAQLDQELSSRVGAVGTALLSPDFGGGENYRLYQLGLPEGAFGEVTATAGTAGASFRVIDGGKYDAAPQVASGLLAFVEASGRSSVVSTASAGGSLQFRLIVQPLPNGGAVALAFPLTSINNTLGGLVWTELLVGLGVTLALAALALVVVRFSLRPLTGIGLTAAAIAEGDLTRRVRNADPHTEVGRLGGSVNAMLSTIENAFDQRTLSEQRLRQFVADASHELRTPITSIRGFAELYRLGGVEDAARLDDIMRRIEQEAIRTGHMVDDLLVLARLDQGRPLEREQVDLVQVVADSIISAEVIRPDRDVEMIAPAELLVEGDADRLRQVVSNLLENAMVYTPASAAIRVRLADERGCAVLEIADEGQGIPPEHLGHIFERFYRVDPSRARASGGSGLGLSIVESVVRAHGGSVAVTSEPGSGSVFRIEMPLRTNPQ